MLRRWLALVQRRPVDSFAAVLGLAAVATIVVNSLFLQPGPHPTPLFAARPLPIAETTGILPRPRPADIDIANTGSRPRSETVAAIQRELALRGFYDGTIDGAPGAKTDASIRDFEQANGIKPTGEANDGLLRAIMRSPLKSAKHDAPVRKDPIADLLAPSKQVMAIQRALSDFGYGQVSPTGLYDPATRAAIERFERDRRMPVTGQISDRVTRELSALSGRPL
jgi:peptidoglycan hydrolase-like protein with peptidoglycan-binding domain